MSVTTGNPNSRFTIANNSSPPSSPVPRGPAMEVRLALSNDPLNTIVSSGSASRNCDKTVATARQVTSFSNEQGPANSRSLVGSNNMRWITDYLDSLTTLTDLARLAGLLLAFFLVATLRFAGAGFLPRFFCFMAALMNAAKRG